MALTTEGRWHEYQILKEMLKKNPNEKWIKNRIKLCEKVLEIKSKK